MTRPFFLTLSLIFITAAITEALPAVSPDAVDAHYRAEGNSTEGLLESAAMIVKALERSGPSDALSWRLARTYYALGKRSQREAGKHYFNLCIQNAERTIELNGQSAWGFFFRAICRGKQGQMQGIFRSLSLIKPVRQDLTTAANLDPSVDHGGPHRALGKMYLDTPGVLGGDLNKSIDHLKLALQYGPRHEENHLFLAQAFYEDGDYIAARETLSALLQITEDSGDNPEIQIIRSQAQELMIKTLAWIESQAQNAQRNKN